MAIIKCKMCGGDMELSADKTFGTCEYCGSTMTLPKVDDDQRAAAFNRGNHFRRIGEFDKALAVYERIVQEDNTDAEAHWCCALCRFGIEYVEDPATYEWIPTCHRASFDSFLEDVDYLAALEHSDGVTRRQYQKDAAKIAEVQKGILATSQNEEPFDVFICYKESDENGQRTKDSLLAQDIYYQLTDAGCRVFFSRITLEDKVGTQYEPYIFAALNSAKIMVAVGTRPEHFNAVWVKNEWSRFLALMKKDRTRLLLPCYRDMDPYDLPEQLSVLQSYDTGKIGFIQDLIRSVKKVLNGDKKPEIKETVVVQQNGEVGKVTALLDRGNMALEDGEWDKADAFFEQVLNNDAHNAGAYIGKALAQECCKTLTDFVSKRKSLTEYDRQETLQLTEDKEHIVKILRETVLEGYVEKARVFKLYQFDRDYQAVSQWRRQKRQEEQDYWANHKQLARAEQFAEGEIAKQLKAAKEDLFRFLDEWVKQGEATDEKTKEEVRKRYTSHLAEADQKAAELRAMAERCREVDYQEWAEAAKNEADPEKLRKAAVNLTHLNGYRDSAELAALCEKKIGEIKAKSAAEAERQRIIREKDAKARAAKNRKIGIIAGIVAVIAIAAVVVVTQVVIPNSKYQAAEDLLDAGQYEEAVAAFEAMGDYKDSAQRAQEAAYTNAERLLAARQYEEAVAAFEAIGDYKDSAQRTKEAAYTNAEQLLAAGQYEEAVAAFEAIGDYKDSAQQAKEAAYTNAEQLLAAGQYEEAVAAFEAIGDYEDSAQRAKEAAYANAERLLDNSRIAEAAISFDHIGDYLDANDRSRKLWEIVAVRQTISAGGYHTVGLKSNGTVVAVGLNFHGQCNVGDWRDIVAVSAGSYHTVGLKSDGTVVAVGRNDYHQCNVSDWTDIVAISARDECTVGLKADGTVVAVGYYVQNGVGDWTDIVAISTGYKHTVGLKSDGAVVATGSNTYEQCYVGIWKDIMAVSAGSGYTVGLKSDGTVVAVGLNRLAHRAVGDSADIVAISAGKYHTVGLQSDGTAVAGGSNSNGQCDVGDWRNMVAISAGDEHTVGLRANGKVVAVGLDMDGQCDVRSWTGIKLPNA